MKEKTCNDCANFVPRVDIPEPKGWICSKCGRSISPRIDVCPYCSGFWYWDWQHPLTVSTTTTTDKVTINTGNVTTETK